MVKRDFLPGTTTRSSPTFIQQPIDRDDFVRALTRAIQAHALNRRVKDRRSALERCASELERIVEEFGRVPATPTSSEP